MKRNQLDFMNIRIISKSFFAAAKHAVEISFLNKTTRISGLQAIVFTVISLVLINTSFGATKTWTGVTNTNWADGTNWLGGIAPASVDDVIIPGGLVNYPVINTTITIRTINVNSSLSGATLSLISGGKLTSTSLITISANGKFYMIEGTLSANGITCNSTLPE
jgi:hypothetical protein